MNRIYRLVFNRALGVWQAVSELAKSRGKLAGRMKLEARSLLVHPGFAGALLAVMASPGAALACDSCDIQIREGALVTIIGGAYDDPRVLSGVISGAGGVTIDNGTVRYSGEKSNTYTGLTTVERDGTLDLNKSGQALAGDLLINGGTVNANRGEQFLTNFVGVDQPYIGPVITLSDDGVLNMNGSQAIGGLRGDSGTVNLDGYYLHIHGNNSGVDGGFGGSLKGRGTITLNDGYLALTGDNSDWNGPMHHYGGTLVAGSDTALGSGLTVLFGIYSTSRLELKGDAALTLGNDIQTESEAVLDSGLHGGILAGVISGSGGLVKQGDSRLTLAADNAYTGRTTVEQGTLQVDGSIARSSLLTVQNGATLAGSGTVGSTTVASGGTIAPGNSVGSLKVNGDLVLAAGSAYLVDIDPGSAASDLVHVSGAATLGGAVMHIGLDGEYAPFAEYVILTADGGVSGAFTEVSSGFAFLDPRLDYTATSVTLALRRNDAAFADKARTRNQRAAAGGVESLAVGHPVYDAVLRLNEAQAAAAFEELSGDSLLAGPAAAQRLGRVFSDGLSWRSRQLGGLAAGGLSLRLQDGLQRLADPTARDFAPLPLAADGDTGPAIGAWAQLQHSRFDEKQDKTTGNAAYGFQGELLSLGLDGYLNEQWLIGGGMGYGSGDLRFDNRAASGDATAWFAGLYARWTSQGPWYASGALSHGRVELEQRRWLSGYGQAWADSRSSNTRLVLEGGLDLNQGIHSMRPYVQLAWQRVHQDGFRERPLGGAELTVSSGTAQAGEISLGLDAARPLWLAGRYARLQAGVSATQRFGDTRLSQRARFGGMGESFTVRSAARDGLALGVAVGGELYLNRRASLWLGYQGRFDSDRDEHDALLGLNVRW